VVAFDNEQYYTYLVMNSSRRGRESIMWFVRLPIGCGSGRVSLARVLTQTEIQKTEGVVGRTIQQRGAAGIWQ